MPHRRIGRFFALRVYYYLQVKQWSLNLFSNISFANQSRIKKSELIRLISDQLENVSEHSNPFIFFSQISWHSELALKNLVQSEQ